MAERKTCAWGAYEYSPGCFASWIEPCYRKESLAINNHCDSEAAAVRTARNAISEESHRHKQTCKLGNTMREFE